MRNQQTMIALRYLGRPCDGGGCSKQRSPCLNGNSSLEELPERCTWMGAGAIRPAGTCGGEEAAPGRRR